MLRNVLAVAGSFLVWSVIWIGFNSVVSLSMPQYFNADGTTDSQGMHAAFLVTSIVCSVLAGWLIPRFAKGPNKTLAWVLAILLLVVGLGVQISFWDAFPLWYNLIFLVALVPATLYGHSLHKG